MTTATSNPTPTLRDLVAAPVPLPVGGIQISVQPLGWYRSVDAIDAIAPALSDMPDDSPDGETMGEWIQWITLHRDSLTRFVVVCTAQPEDDIRALAPSLLAELVFGLLEVNADFFVESLPRMMHNLAPRVAGLMERVAVALARATGEAAKMAVTASPGPSSASSSTGTSSAN